MTKKNQKDSGSRSAKKPQADSGIRPTQFGLKALIAVGLFSALLTALVIYISGGFCRKEKQDPAPPPTVSLPKEIEPAPAPVVVPDPPKPPTEEVNMHPLAGEKYILAGQPGNWRHSYLSWTRGLAGADYPLVTVERNDPCVWRLIGVEGSKDVYRIFYSPPDADADWAGAELSYSSFDETTFATVESNDPCKWKIIPMGDSEKYRIICDLESLRDGDSIVPLEEHDLDVSHPMAGLERNFGVGWKIVPIDELPEPSKPVTHVIIYPRGDLDQIDPDAAETVRDWAEDIASHIEDDGWQTLKLTLTLADENTLNTSHGGLTFEEAAKKIRAQNDPIADVLPGSLKAPKILGEITGEAAGDDLNDIRKVEPFPVVIPLITDGHIKVENIRAVEFWDDGFFAGNKSLEETENFQMRLDESNQSDRIYHGAKFTYVFIGL